MGEIRRVTTLRELNLGQERSGTVTISASRCTHLAGETELGVQPRQERRGEPPSSTHSSSRRRGSARRIMHCSSDVTMRLVILQPIMAVRANLKSSSSSIRFGSTADRQPDEPLLRVR
jgi:hypothetical protein